MDIIAELKASMLKHWRGGLREPDVHHAVRDDAFSDAGGVQRSGEIRPGQSYQRRARNG
jgi:hypothetical protein